MVVRRCKGMATEQPQSRANIPDSEMVAYHEDKSLRDYPCQSKKSFNQEFYTKVERQSYKCPGKNHSGQSRELTN